jgi:hypothetical protein
MEKSMKLSIDDYERAIVRIFYKNEDKAIAIGTGFLVTPGYVLTCAHVVLQALGISASDFGISDTPLGKHITLDFPITNSDRITAEVVAWRPFSIDRGDIAGLRLLTIAPHQSKPIPIIRCSYEEIQNQRHAVYGFANDNGDRTDSYKPKSNAPGGRFQLHKVDENPPDEMIQAGFSGAPVWNYERNAVIGMVATAALSKDQRSKAFAIHEESLNPVMQELFARSLHDLICFHLESAYPAVKDVIEKALWLCDTDGNRTKSEDLLHRLLYLGELSNRGWKQGELEIDRLTQFAMFLTVIDGLPKELVHEIAEWIKFRGFDYNALYVKANSYRQDRKVFSTEASAHLVVQIRPDEQDVQDIYVSIWVIDNRDCYDLLEPYPPLVREQKVVFTELPTFLETWLQEESDLTHPMIHCFVARHLLGSNLDACETESGLTLGNQYKLVMRTDLTQSPIGRRYYTLWQKKWKSFEGKQHSIAREVFVRSDCRDRRQLYTQLISAEMAILENVSYDQVEDIFKFIAEKVALPIVLWVRQDELSNELDRILDCPSINLPEKVFQERLQAMDESCLGYHLSLVWEDPKVIPPTMFMPLMQ